MSTFFNPTNSDASTAYALNHNYFIYFQHIPTGLISKFKAFITDFDDQYECNWNDVDVYGRMDPISTYQGTKRTIKFSFDVVAGSKDEALYNFENSRRLISSLYPVYEEISAGVFSATSIQAPPLMRVRFANLIAGGVAEGISGGLVGKLSGINYVPDFEAGVFQAYNQVLPKVNKFSCNYSVLHTQGLGFSTDGSARGNNGSSFPYLTTHTGRHNRRDASAGSFNTEGFDFSDEDEFSSDSDPYSDAELLEQLGPVRSFYERIPGIDDSGLSFEDAIANAEVREEILEGYREDLLEGQAGIRYERGRNPVATAQAARARTARRENEE